MKILLVGAGGYASLYVNALLNSKNPDICFEGIVDPYFANCRQKESIINKQIPIYNTMEEFYAKHTADLAVISTPPFLHLEQSLFAVSHGSDVLCEKPAAPTVGEVKKMIEAEKEYGKFIAIGYQWSYSSSMQQLKQDILNGAFGKAISFKTVVSWPRNRAYYGRSTGWAGKISKNGVLVLDSIASNACAHYLHNMFFLLGKTMNTSAFPLSISADCFRANFIENFDTCAIKIQMPENVRLLFIASHAAEKTRNPEFIYKFENAVVSYSKDDGDNIIANFFDGRVKSYGSPFDDATIKLWKCVDAVNSGKKPICTAETALAHTELIGMLYANVPIFDFPEEAKRINIETDGIYVEGLYDIMYRAYKEEKLFSEIISVVNNTIHL